MYIDASTETQTDVRTHTDTHTDLFIFPYLFQTRGRELQKAIYRVLPSFFGNCQRWPKLRETLHAILARSHTFLPDIKRCKYTPRLSLKPSADEPIIIPLCIPILDLVGVHRKLEKGVLHAYTMEDKCYIEK